MKELMPSSGQINLQLHVFLFQMCQSLTIFMIKAGAYTFSGVFLLQFFICFLDVFCIIWLHTLSQLCQYKRKWVLWKWLMYFLHKEHHLFIYLTLYIYTGNKQISLLWQKVLGFVTHVYHKTCEKANVTSNQGSVTILYF